MLQQINLRLADGFWQRLWGAKMLAFMATFVFSLLLFVSTLQMSINGMIDPYTTDVGEIQNALPRWGTLHFTGYPLYSVLGSAWVTLWQFLGLEPAAGASLYSALWGVVTLGFLVAIAFAFEVPPFVASITALLFALSTSMWIDSSLAEVHTMTMALTLAALWVAIRVGREGRKSDVYGLAFLVGQGLAHQRSFAFLGLGLLLLVIPQWRAIWRLRWGSFALVLLGPLTYLYLPLRAWQGSEWLFSETGTWAGFWQMALDTKADRIVAFPASSAELWGRAEAVFKLLSDDWPWPLLLAGLLGLLFVGQGSSWRERIALTLSWLPYWVLSLIIWEGEISDALLAVKMPIVALAAVGLGFIGQELWVRTTLVRYGSVVMWLVIAMNLYTAHKPKVVEITGSEQAEEILALIEQIPPSDGRPITFMALWGNSYWQIAYAQAYQKRFSDLTLVDHDTDFSAILAEGDHLLTRSRTFYESPLEWWEERAGPVMLSSVAPGIIEISSKLSNVSERKPLSALSLVQAKDFLPQESLSDAPYLLELGNGIAISRASLAWHTSTTLLLTVEWQALQKDLSDYSVAVHLLAQNPPLSAQDLITQADSKHPVDGWYPTSRWSTGEVIQDHYLLEVPAESAPVAVRVGMYRQLEDGQFENSAWLFLDMP